MLEFADRVKETSTTTGTGTLNLAGAVTGYQTFVAGIGDTNTCYYCIEDANGAWETGIGTITDAAPDTIARSVLKSSNADALISCSADTTIFATPIERIFKPKQTIWVPAGAMVPAVTDGCAALATTETTALRPDISELAFADDVDNHAQFSVGLPKGWDKGDVTFQAFWTGLEAGAGGVSWGLAGLAVSDDDTIDAVLSTPIVVDDTFIAIEDMHVSVESAALTITGTPLDDDLIYFNILRDVSDGNDTRVAPANLIGIKLLFTLEDTTDI